VTQRVACDSKSAVENASVDAKEIVARLDALRVLGLERVREATLLAFDGDGTLWSGDVGFDLFEALLDLGDVREAAREGLAVEARSIGLASDVPALELARSLYRSYQDGGWAHDRAFAAMAWAFAGWSSSEMSTFAKKVVEKTGLASRIRRSLAEVVKWAQASEVEVFIVSASPHSIVACGAELLDIPIANVIAMTPDVDHASILQPRLVGHVIYGDGKYAALKAARPDASILGAFGDSFYDAPMLRASHLPVAVEPSAGLRDILSSIPGVVVLPA
jgi:phosphatidylglycerophosphatase C